MWEPKIHYLDTASYGLPPRPALAAVRVALEEWRDGTGSWEKWSDATHAARALFARLTKVDAKQVAIGAAVSQLVGQVAASLLPGSRVLVPEQDFTSLTWPFLVRRELGVDVITSPLSELADRIDDEVNSVAFSAVQSADGTVADMDEIAETAHAHGAEVLVDATQACGWRPVDATRFDYLVCAGYKWLMAPRGTAFLAASKDRVHDLRPLAPGWFASEDIYASYYGDSIALAASARRLDTSPAWFSWIGARASLEIITRIGVENIMKHNLGLADAFSTAVGGRPAGSAIVSVPLRRSVDRLQRHSVKVSLRQGRMRASFHIYNTEEDVAALIEAIT